MNKIKSATIVLCALFTLSFTNGYSQIFDEGDNVINVMIGFGAPTYGYNGFYSSGSYSKSPIISASYEHCYFDDLINGDFSVGIGGYFGFYTSKYRFGSGGYDYTYLIPAARGTFHWEGVENLDLYAGIHLGGRIAISNVNGDPFYTDPTNLTPFYGAFRVGARYYFTDSFGVTSELGSGDGVFNIGVCFKF